MSMDASELRALSVDLGEIGVRGTKAMFPIFKDAGNDLRDEWKSNARATSGDAARFYPESITADVRLSTNIEAEIGPDRRLKQGKLGPILEYGSPTSPAHLDGQRAADTVVPRIDKRIDSALGHLGL